MKLGSIQSSGKSSGKGILPIGITIICVLLAVLALILVRYFSSTHDPRSNATGTSGIGSSVQAQPSPAPINAEQGKGGASAVQGGVQLPESGNKAETSQAYDSKSNATGYSTTGSSVGGKPPEPPLNAGHGKGDASGVSGEAPSHEPGKKGGASLDGYETEERKGEGTGYLVPIAFGIVLILLAFVMYTGYQSLLNLGDIEGKVLAHQRAIYGTVRTHNDIQLKSLAEQQAEYVKIQTRTSEMETSIAGLTEDLVQARKDIEKNSRNLTTIWSGLKNNSIGARQQDGTMESVREQLIEILASPDDELRKCLAAIRGGALDDSGMDPGGSSDEIHEIRRRLGGLEDQVQQVFRGDMPQIRPSSSPDLLRMTIETERQLLEAAWLDLYDNGGIARLITSAVGDGGQQFELIDAVGRLTTLLKRMDNIGPLVSEIAEPVLRYRETCDRFRSIRGLLSDPAGKNGQELLCELKKATLFLGILRFSDHARRDLNLDIPCWTIDHFPRLADAFYREYQLAQRRGETTQIEEARSLVDALLSSVGLRVLKITLARTPFDDRFHMARSTSSDMSIPDGTISGVIRNGFEKSDGGWILHQQAEVIVNRI